MFDKSDPVLHLMAAEVFKRSTVEQRVRALIKAVGHQLEESWARALIPFDRGYTRPAVATGAVDHRGEAVRFSAVLPRVPEDEDDFRRVTDLATQELVLREDQHLRKQILERAFTVSSPTFLEALENARAYLIGAGRVRSVITINRWHVPDLVKLSLTTLEEAWTPCTDRAAILGGLIATSTRGGIELRTAPGLGFEEVVPAGEILALQRAPGARLTRTVSMMGSSAVFLDTVLELGNDSWGGVWRTETLKAPRPAVP